MANVLEAKVGTLGDSYADGTPNLEIKLPAGRAVGQAFVNPAETPITLRVAGRDYSGHVLANKPDHELVWISPTLRGSGGERTTLGRVLTAAGFHSKDAVSLSVSGTLIEVLAATGSPDAEPGAAADTGRM